MRAESDPLVPAMATCSVPLRSMLKEAHLRMTHHARGLKSSSMRLTATVDLAASRAHVKRREGNGCNITCSKRWGDGVRQRQLKSAVEGQDQGDNDPGALYNVRRRVTCS